MLICSCNKNYIENVERSRRIDKILKREKRRMKKEIKILLLGAGESGKSTIMKQMKIIHGENLLENQSLENSRHIIYQNILKGMKILIDARVKFNIPWENEEKTKAMADFVFRADTKNIITLEYFSRYASLIQYLWKDSAIQTTFQRRNEFQLSDGLRYLFDNLKRISGENYVPTNQDMLHSRVPTMSICEYSVDIKGVPFIFIDVGGQRKQRSKWLQCLDNVTSILFIVSSIEYDQYLVEDWRKNRLEESIAIFEEIVNYKFFNNVSFILFLNKTDLLVEKIKNLRENIKKSSKSKNYSQELEPNYRFKTIQHYFSNYTGDPTDIKQVQSFLISLFESRCNVNGDKKLYYHLTTAVDTENINIVFKDVRKTIRDLNIAQLMLQ